MALIGVLKSLCFEIRFEVSAEMLIVLSDFRIAKDVHTATLIFKNLMLDGKLSDGTEKGGVSYSWIAYRNVYFTVTQDYLKRARPANSDFFDITGNSED